MIGTTQIIKQGNNGLPKGNNGLRSGGHLFGRGGGLRKSSRLPAWQQMEIDEIAIGSDKEVLVDAEILEDTVKMEVNAMGGLTLSDTRSGFSLDASVGDAADDTLFDVNGSPIGTIRKTEKGFDLNQLTPAMKKRITEYRAGTNALIASNVLMEGDEEDMSDFLENLEPEAARNARLAAFHSDGVSQIISFGGEMQSPVVGEKRMAQVMASSSIKTRANRKKAKK
jgi:hypothetical protein